MTALLLRIASQISAARVRRRLALCEIGEGTWVSAWRIRPQARGALRIGQRSNVRAAIVYERPGAVVEIGSRSFVGAGLIACADRICIGDDVLTSWGVTIVDHDSHATAFSLRSKDAENWLRGTKDWTHVRVRPVTIESKVWIGMNASILRGAVIGEGAIVGAGAVVTRSVPAWTIVAGNPARVIREIPPDER